VLDLKLGAQLWDDAASPEKRARLDAVSRNTTSGSLGFRVAGMKVYKGTAAVGSDPAIDGTGYRVYDKYYGRTFAAENVIDAFKDYLTSEIKAEQVKLVAGRCLRKVSDIKEVLQRQESRMYSASLLFCYEGDRRAIEDALKEEEERDKVIEEQEEYGEEEEAEENEKKFKKIVDVKLIDFAHATWTPGLGPDENALQGVRSVEKLLEQLTC